MRILFIGDIVGKPGRRAVSALLPDLRREFRVDVVIANVENAAHGKGLTASTWKEIQAAGVDIGTGGNHSFSKPEGSTLYDDPTQPLLRPMNFTGVAGQGQKTFHVGQKTLLVINCIGEFGMQFDNVDNPFVALQQWMQDHPVADTILVDFHAEATSEKVNAGWLLDGQVAAVLGTHTHIPTADARVLPKGTGYITDVGMVGLKNSSLGVDKDLTLERFLTGRAAPNVIPDFGLVTLNAVLIEAEGNHCTKITQIIRDIDIKE